MNKQREHFNTTATSKFITILRKHALIERRITMSEMLELYQQAYLRELEREKSEKKKAKQSEGSSEKGS